MKRKVKLHIAADWRLRNTAATHETEKDKRSRRNSKLARHEMRKTLDYEE